MRFKTILYYEGRILLVMAPIVLLPIVAALAFKETANILPFVYTAIVFAVIGGAFSFFTRSEKKKLGSKEGLAVVGFSWIFVSAIGALPFTISGAIPNYLNALFETASGFTTTGATILSDIESLPKCMLFWRTFTQWLGGMGILVFILAVLPTNDASAYNLLKFESPGPQVGKLVSKVRLTAAILYGIYIALTLLELIMLLFSGIGFFDALMIALSTAGTGGFLHLSQSIASYNNLYVEIVVTLFMFLFALNFNIYYFLILKSFKSVFADSELKFYVSYVVLFSLLIAANLVNVYGNFFTALRYSSFTVVSMASTTCFTSADYTAWPEFSKTILFVVMFIGASAGGTGGGFKVSRMVIILKSSYAHLCSVLRPSSIQIVKFNGKLLKEEDASGVEKYFFIYWAILFVAVIILSLGGRDFPTNFSAALCCFNNDGVGFTSLIGPYGNFLSFAWWEKIVLMGLMLMGRLEIYPILLLFLPKMWKKNV